MAFGMKDIKANPTFFAAMIVAIIGIIVAAYGKFRKSPSKAIQYGGLALMIGALLVAAISHFRKGQTLPPDNGDGNDPTRRGPPVGTGFSGVTTPL